MFTKKFLISLLTATVLAPFMALAAGVPDDVANVTATAETNTTIKLTWDATLDENDQPVAKYRIYYGNFSVFAIGEEAEYPSTINTPTNAATYTVTGLTPNTNYYFAVTAISTDAQESNAYSYEATAKTKVTPAPVPPAPDAEEDVTSPTVSSAKSVDSTHITVLFSEAVTLPVINAKSAFSIKEQINPAKTLQVINAGLDPKDATGKTVLLETAAQGKNVNYLVTAGAAVTDKSANPIVSGNTDTALFAGSDVGAVAETTPDEITMLETPAPVTTTSEPPLPVVDLTPPENITSLVLSWKAQAEKFIILMDWKASIDTAKDLADQIMYMSLDRGTTYDGGQSLGSKAVHSEVPNLEGGKEYTFKITTKDASGNESVGAVKAIRLPSSGAAAGLLLLGAAEGARRILRRKKQN